MNSIYVQVLPNFISGKNDLKTLIFVLEFG